MVELDVGPPAGGVVTLLAIAAEAAGMHVAAAVAADAFGAELLGGDRCRVALVAGHFLVPSEQRPVGIARVVEVRGFPLVTVVTIAAVTTQAAGVRVLRLVASRALARQLVLEVAAAVT